LNSEEEVLHMADVKDVMRVLFRVNEVALAMVLGSIALRFLWSGEATFRTLAWDSLKGLGLGLALVAVVGALSLVGFEAAWEQFHELLFTNDFWQLDPDTDRLIQMFPEAYWQESVLIIAALILLEGLAVAALAGGYLFATREGRATTPAPSA
jgi:integral membrane protein (TIGR01906 family)